MVNGDEDFKKDFILKRVEAFLKAPVGSLLKYNGMALL